ncbi:MAG: hemerythrin domain-containing protein [Actinomycetota bacterium]|nr:hemerythrin domain-containing protein [Actinomycetota bacterium]
MAVTDLATTSPLTAPATELRPVVYDLYRDIHKGIRAELFALTQAAGDLDPSSEPERHALADQMHQVVTILVNHAGHEDAWVQPALERHLPPLAERIHADHPVLEARIEDLLGRAEDNAAATTDLRWRTHRLYVETASFTSAYLAHQDFEERVVMPALEAAIGPEAVIEMDRALVAAIPPDEAAATLAFMIPAMNIDDRADLLGGMREGAPADLFAGVWGLVRSVLDPRDVDALAARLDL